MPVHSYWLLVAKKFDILKPLVAKTCDRWSVGINICVKLSVAINPVGHCRLIATPLKTTYTSVAITAYSDRFRVPTDWLWYSDGEAALRPRRQPHRPQHREHPVRRHHPDDFLAEVDIINLLRHRNVMPLVGMFFYSFNTPWSPAS